MNRTKSHGFLALLSAIAVAGCDPYEAQNKAAPAIQRVNAIDSAFTAAIDPTLDQNATLTADGSYAVTGVSLGTFDGNFDPSIPIDPNAATLTTMPQCHSHAEMTDACQWASTVAIVIQTNQLLNGDTIQTSPSDCTPSPAGNFSFSPAPDPALPNVTTDPPGGRPASKWYTCYNPTSATAGEGASIVVFQSDTPDDPLAGAFLPVGDTTVSGTVKSQTGANLSFTVRVVGVAAAPDYPDGFNPTDPVNFE